VLDLTGCEDSSTVRDAEVVTGLATEENRVLDLTVSCTVSDLGGGKRNAASQGAGKRGSKRHQTSARAADDAASAGADPAPLAPDSVRASRKGKPGRKQPRSQYVDDEAQDDAEEAEEEEDEEFELRDAHDDEVGGARDGEPHDPVLEAASNRRLDSEREALDAEETRAFAERYQALTAALDQCLAAELPGDSMEINASSAAGASPSERVNCSSLDDVVSHCVTSLKFEERRSDLDGWLVRHSLALLAVCKSNCNVQAVTSQAITFYVTKYVTKPNKDNAVSLRNAMEGAEKALARATSPVAAVVGESGSSASARLAAEEEQRRLEFNRGLGVLCSAVREHTKEESLALVMPIFGGRSSSAHTRLQI
jgi:hypothetical protein